MYLIVVCDGQGVTAVDEVVIGLANMLKVMDDLQPAEQYGEDTSCKLSGS